MYLFLEYIPRKEQLCVDSESQPERSYSSLWGSSDAAAPVNWEESSQTCAHDAVLQLTWPWCRNKTQQENNHIYKCLFRIWG